MFKRGQLVRHNDGGSVFEFICYLYEDFAVAWCFKLSECVLIRPEQCSLIGNNFQRLGDKNDPA